MATYNEVQRLLHPELEDILEDEFRQLSMGWLDHHMKHLSAIDSLKIIKLWRSIQIEEAHKHEGAFGNNNTRRQGDVEDADCNIMFEMLNNGPWTVEEDDLLLNLVITHIAEKWPLIASQVTGRTDQQCRDRWFHHLKPLAMQKHYSKQEDRIMLIAHMKLGNCWSTLSKAFYGNRSSTSLVQRFHGPVKRSIETHLKKKPTYVGVSEDGRYPLSPEDIEPILFELRGISNEIEIVDNASQPMRDGYVDSPYPIGSVPEDVDEGRKAHEARKGKHKFTWEEEVVMLQVHLKTGSRWTELASHLAHRTGSVLRKHWHTHILPKLELFLEDKYPNAKDSRRYADPTTGCYSYEPSDAEDILLVSMDKDKDRSAVHKRRVTVSAIDAAPTQVGPAGMAVSAGLEGAGGGSRIVKRRIRRQASDIWSPEEDKRIIELYSLHPDKWQMIAYYLPGQTAGSCKERWQTHLNPVINKGEWTLAEDKLMLTAHLSIGNRWSDLCKVFTGRTSFHTRNHWYGPIKRYIDAYMNVKYPDALDERRNPDRNTGCYCYDLSEVDAILEHWSPSMYVYRNSKHVVHRVVEESSMSEGGDQYDEGDSIVDEESDEEFKFTDQDLLDFREVYPCCSSVDDMRKTKDNIPWEGRSIVGIVDCGGAFYDGGWRINRNMTKYSGRFQFHGYGLFSYGAASAGRYYIGYFENSEFHGQGSVYWDKECSVWVNNRHPASPFKNAAVFEYFGSFQHNKYHGRAICVFKDGSTMITTWCEGVLLESEH